VRKEARKAQVLDGIAWFTAYNGYPPSYRDVATYVGIAHSFVYDLIRELRADGLIDAQTPKVSRTLTLTDAGRDAVRSANLSRRPEPAGG
jgi:predicted transcriptional regulator